MTGGIHHRFTSNLVNHQFNFRPYLKPCLEIGHKRDAGSIVEML